MRKKITAAVLTTVMALLMTTTTYASTSTSSNVMQELSAGAGGEGGSVSVYDKEGASKSDTTATEKSATEKSATEKSATEKSATEKSATEKSATEKSASEKSETSGSDKMMVVIKTTAGAGSDSSESSTSYIDTGKDKEATQSGNETVSQGSVSESSAQAGSTSSDSTSENKAVSTNAAQSSSDNEYANLCITTVEDSMNVRSDATEEAGVVGYLYKDCVGEIIEQRDGWTKVKSGKLEGWASNDYLLFGDEASEKIAAAVMKIAVINTETLRVREAGSEDAPVTSLLAIGDEVDVIGTEGEGWTQISYEDGTEGSIKGFICNEYISIKKSYKQGETIAEVEDREARAAAEKKKSDQSKASSGSSSKSGGSQTSSTSTTNNGAVSASVDDATLLAALIQCECNGPYEGQLAVGAVVMNRVKSGYGSISNAIYAPGQFGPASSGKLAATLSTGAISATAKQAANDAISGVSNVGSAKYFRNVRSGHAGIVIGSHVFW